MKIRKNHKILGMLKAGVSTCVISKKSNMSYSGAKMERRLQSCSWFWMETTDQSDHLVIKISKSSIPIKQQLVDKLEAQMRVKGSTKTIQCPLKKGRHLWRKISKKLFVTRII